MPALNVSDELKSKLNGLLADAVVYYFKLHNYHWFVTGHRFEELHQKFEELYLDAAVKVDEIAERVLALGGRPLSTLKSQLDAARANAEQALDPAVAAALEAVLHSDDRGERKKAAKQLLAHEPESAVPSYGRLVARMTDAKSCEGKKSVIKEIAAAGDARALPALEKLSAIRRSGCKPRGKGDCFGCLRRTLGGAIKGLKGEAADSA